MTLLHACVRYNPQVPLLLKMTELHPESLRIKDCIDRTPLHVAAGSGVSLFVIRILTSKYPHACNIQDEDGRTPLHFACDTNCELVLRGQRKLTKRSTLSRYRVCPPCGLVRRGDVGRCQWHERSRICSHFRCTDWGYHLITKRDITCNPQTVNAIVPAIKPSDNHLLRISGVLSTVFNRKFFLKENCSDPFWFQLWRLPTSPFLARSIAS